MKCRTLKNYLARGGRLLLMYDPEFPVTPELQSLLGDVGLKVGSGMVLDPVNHSGTEEDKVAVPYYPPHPITDQVALTVFPGPRPLELARQNPGDRGNNAGHHEPGKLRAPDRHVDRVGLDPAGRSA